MPPADGDLERLERVRQEADRRYNAALTALDAALVRATALPAETVTLETAPLELPGGWRGKMLQLVHQWLQPWMVRQQAYNLRTTAAIEALIAQERVRAAGFERF